MVVAVSPSVALPAGVDALPAGALELLLGAHPDARGRDFPRAVLRRLVRAVRTVGVSVADPQAGHALRVIAAEGRRAAGGGGARVLIAAVQAVGVIVAHEGKGHALAVLTLELIVRAGLRL